MSSFNHRVIRNTEANRQWRGAIGELCRHGANRKTNPGGCGKPADWVVIYDYVTGRAGRVTDSQRGKCREHAEQFAKKHGCKGPADIDYEEDAEARNRVDMPFEAFDT